MTDPVSDYGNIRSTEESSCKISPGEHRKYCLQSPERTGRKVQCLLRSTRQDQQRNSEGVCT